MLIDGELTDSDVSPSSSGTGLPIVCHQQQARNQKLLNLRKIKSRNAARTRRGKENYEFYELAKLLPIPAESATQLDKASIVRLTMCFLQVRDLYSDREPDWKIKHDGPPPNKTVKDTSAHAKVKLHQSSLSEMMEEHLGAHILQSLGGFMFILDSHGRIIYVSETVSLLLGLSQVEMIGSSIFDYVYSDDTNELAVNLSLTLNTLCGEQSKEGNDCTQDHTYARSFFVRIKSALAKRGIGQKSSCYRVVHLCTRARPHSCNSRRKTYTTASRENVSSRNQLKSTKIVAFGSVLPALNLTDLPLLEGVLVMRVNSSLQITYCEPMVEKLLGYTVREILGQSLYRCLHIADIKKLQSAHIDLLAKGHTETPYFRILHKLGGFRWISATAILMPNQRLYPERSYIWMHSVISEVVHSKLKMDEHQVCQKPVPEKSGVIIAKCGKAKKEQPCIKLDCSGQTESRQTDELTKSKPPQNLGETSDQKIRTMTSNSDVATSPHDNLSSDDVKDCFTCLKDGTDDNIDSNSNRRPSNYSESSSVSDVSEIPAKRPRADDCAEATTAITSERMDAKPSCNQKYDAALKIYCVRSRLAEQLSNQPSLRCSDFVSEYMDINSTYWSNPPNKEISNHNDLPAGIKEMGGMLSVRHTPSAVHHHYPFGINPTLLHSNPLLSKFMAAGWEKIRSMPATDTFMLAGPVQMVPSYHMPKLCDRSKFSLDPSRNPALFYTPASVAAVLKELKTDPLHRVNPPNKVVTSSTETRDSSLGQFSTPIEDAKTLAGNISGNIDGGRECASSLNSTYGTSSQISAPTVMQVPSTLLVSSNGLLFGSSDAPLFDFGSSSALHLPIVSATSFPQRLSPCVMQALAFPQIAKVRSVPF